MLNNQTHTDMETLATLLEQEINRQELMIKTGYGAPEIKGVPLSENAIQMCKDEVSNMIEILNYLNSGGLPSNAPENVLKAVDAIYDYQFKMQSQLEEFDF